MKALLDIYKGADKLWIKRTENNEDVFCKITMPTHNFLEGEIINIRVNEIEKVEALEDVKELLSHFGELQSQPTVVIYGENCPEYIRGKQTGSIEAKIKLTSPPPEILAIDGKRVRLSYRGIKKSCYKCYQENHSARECPEMNKIEWNKYLDQLETKL